MARLEFKAKLLEPDDMRRAITRIAHEILESNRGPEHLVILGIPTRGVVLANRIAALIAQITESDAVVGALDVTMHRDDLAKHPTRAPAPTLIPAGGIDGSTVVLVDDVLYSGRTIRAALDALAAADAVLPLDLGAQPGLEAQVAALADDIAYDNHDLDDGVRAIRQELSARQLNLPGITLLY